MKIQKRENRIFYNFKNKSFANISIHQDSIKLELLETLPQYRRQNLANEMLEFILDYIKEHMKGKTIYLNPLPLDRYGMNLQELKTFYQKFGFKTSKQKEQHCPHLMELLLF